jgi:hypothetical protein
MVWACDCRNLEHLSLSLAGSWMIKTLKIIAKLPAFACGMELAWYSLQARSRQIRRGARNADDADPNEQHQPRRPEVAEPTEVFARAWPVRKKGDRLVLRTGLVAKAAGSGEGRRMARGGPGDGTTAAARKDRRLFLTFSLDDRPRSPAQGTTRAQAGLCVPAALCVPAVLCAPANSRVPADWIDSIK